jgi:hypothetical protein
MCAVRKADHSSFSNPEEVAVKHSHFGEPSLIWHFVTATSPADMQQYMLSQMTSKAMQLMLLHLLLWCVWLFCCTLQSCMSILIAKS